MTYEEIAEKLKTLSAYAAYKLIQQKIEEEVEDYYDLRKDIDERVEIASFEIPQALTTMIAEVNLNKDQLLLLCYYLMSAAVENQMYMKAEIEGMIENHEDPWNV